MEVFRHVQNFAIRGVFAFAQSMLGIASPSWILSRHSSPVRIRRFLNYFPGLFVPVDFDGLLSRFARDHAVNVVMQV